MGDINNKLRILKLMEILDKETDTENELTIKDIILRLNDNFGESFTVEKKAIVDDIATLDESGFYVIKNTGEYNRSLYSHQDRLFELYELRMLIDAVSSARFITKKETKNLIEKIKKLTSNGLAKNLQNQIHIDDKVKSEDFQVKFYIDKIHKTISEGKRVKFQYGNYNVNKDFYLHRGGNFYVVTPYGLVWSNDYYYLVGADEIHEDVVNYRVDRMRNVEITEEKFQKNDFNVEEHLKRTFNMYTGPVEVVEIQFDNHLINVVIDRFGKDVNLSKVDDNSFKIRIHAAISKGLIRWILTWGSDARVLSPKSLADEIKDESIKMLGLYK